ncbi:head-tail connector protein [Gemmobacter serpentinus]|uniref:head-tail connector protein n=1 Tax=Gemmobacter serpentinus TaxID=2652247 RepID=UPI00124BEBFD|nr:head-tail connector protein [Gemmobacter serpentinus]
MPIAITVPELKAYLNLPISLDEPPLDTDDTLLSLKIDAAEAYCASFIGTPIPDPAPAAIKQAVLMLAAYWYEMREAATVGGNPYSVPFGVHDLLQAHHVWVV